MDDEWMWWLGGLALLGGFVALMVLVYREQKKRVEKQRKYVEALGNLYKKALDRLEAHPHNPEERKNALTYGRAYYAETMPDTYTLHYIDGIPAGTSDHQNNAAGREARIASDIDARVGHLKLRSAEG